MGSEYLFWIIVVLVAYHLFVSARVLLSSGYTGAQKALQLLIIGSIPLMGAILCHVFLSTDGKPMKKRETAFAEDEGNNPPGIRNSPERNGDGRHSV